MSGYGEHDVLPLDPTALQGTPVFTAKRPVSPRAPVLRRTDSDPPLLLNDDPPASASTPFNPSIPLPPQGFQAGQQAEAPLAQPASQQYNEFTQQQFGAPLVPLTQYSYAPVDFSCLSQQPFQQTYPQQGFASPQYPQQEQYTYNVYTSQYMEPYYEPLLPGPTATVTDIPSWDRPVPRGNEIVIRLEPLAQMDEIMIHIRKHLDDICIHNDANTAAETIAVKPVVLRPQKDAEHFEFSLDNSPAPVDIGITVAHSPGVKPGLEQNQAPGVDATQAQKEAQERADQEEMRRHRAQLREIRREQRRATRRADRAERKQRYEKDLQKKHEANLKAFATILCRRTQQTPICARTTGEHGNVITPTHTARGIPPVLQTYNCSFTHCAPIPHLQIGNKYGRLFWPGSTDTSSRSGENDDASGLKIGPFFLSVDDFLERRPVFIAAHTHIPPAKEQDIHKQDLKESISSVPGMQLLHCDTENGLFYAIKFPPQCLHSHWLAQHLKHSWSRYEH